MQTDTLEQYRAQRAAGWPARHALAHARTLSQWRAAGGETLIDADDMSALDDEAEPGAVRLLVLYDDHPHDLSYVDTWTDLSRERRDRIKREISDRIERKGLWGIESQVFTLADGWTHCDSVWDFIGDDWSGSGYDLDLMRAALDARAALLTGPDY